jgi:cysteinyl-tRNA synthetase
MFSNFQYQLQNERYKPILESSAELVVVDVDDCKFTPAQVAAIAETKTILSYLSIGQASNVRWYWNKSWVDADGNPIPGAAPAWLGPKNADWAGAYEVRYWDPEWRAILMQGIDRILAAGYAGAVYDVVDSFEHWAEVPEAPEEMKALVKALMDYGRSRNPDYIGIPNLGYQLLVDSSYLSAISGQLAESVFYLKGGPRPPSDTDWATDFLDRVTAAGKQVFVIEYVYPPEMRCEAARKAKSRGYVPYMTMKALNSLEPVWQTYETA